MEATHVRNEVIVQIEECKGLLREGTGNIDLVISKLDSAELALANATEFCEIPWANTVLNDIRDVIELLLNEQEFPSLRVVGRPRLNISFQKVEFFLSMGFKVPETAKMFGVSLSTIERTLRRNNYCVRSTYTTISDEELGEVIIDILKQQPNTGYKRMRGHLMTRSIRVTEKRVRETLKYVDPVGVYQRTLDRNREIRRRTYYVPFSNQMWHLDGNHKLIRWGIFIRSGIDGKSRTMTYVEATDNNRSDSHLLSFLNGVQRFGVPYRTRSDKGKENVGIARFMIEARGVDRASHICGRSVHNQRIERLWRDLFYGCISLYYSLFSSLENDGLLDIDNLKHIELLHWIFIPWLNNHLSEFMRGWNNHPLSSEHYKTPLQLMVLHLPPSNWDLELGQVEMLGAEILCNNVSDTDLLVDDENEGDGTNSDAHALTRNEIERLSLIDTHRASDSFGYDIYQDAIQILENV